MTSSLNGIDHCVILVRDLNIACQKMADLGFTVTPRGVHSPHMGTANHCIMLRRAYFEVLSVCEPTEFNELWREKLNVREGLDAVPISSDDVGVARAELIVRGLDLPAEIDFSRPVDLPEGPAEAIFRLVMIPGSLTPEITMFMIQHFTRDVVWHPKYLDHPNGAKGVLGVTAIHKRPAAVAAAYRKIFGSEAVTVTEESVRIDTGAGEILFLTPAGYAERYPGIAPDPAARTPYLAALSIDVEDRVATSVCLRENHVSYEVLPGGTLCVAPAQACGTLLEFV